MNALRFSAVRLVGVASATVAIVAVALTGCPREVDFGAGQGRPVVESGTADLTAVSAKLDSIDEWNRSASFESIVSELNEWVRRAPASADWRRDPLIDEMPQEFLQGPMLRGLAGTDFVGPDVQFLIERRLLHATSDRIVSRGVSDGADLFLVDAPLADASSTPSAARLEVSPREKALLLFDWTVRNVALQPMSAAPPRPEDPSGPSLAVMQGAPGAGYVLPLDQILLRGQADAWMRLRAFLALCEQQGLPGVALGAATGNAAEPQAPRLAGVFVDDELLMFDVALGMPLPDGKGGVASFADFKADPSAWKSAVETAAAEGAAPREFAFVDPTKLVAFVPADPFSLSRRIAILEGEWTGADRVRMTNRPSDLAERAKAAGVERAAIWILPFESLVFEASIAELARAGTPGMQEFLRERQIFSPPTPIYFGRKRYLVGPPPGEEESQTAKQIFMAATLTEEQLNEIETSREVQKLLGYDRFLEQLRDEEQKKAFLAQARGQLASIKKLARYYLAYAQYQDRDFGQAEWWFNEAAKQSDEGVWRTGSYYNLGRSLEAQGKHSSAVSVYRQDRSAQRPMSLLRADRLAKRAGLAEKTTEVEAPSEESAAAPAEPTATEEAPADEPPAATPPEATETETAKAEENS